MIIIDIFGIRSLQVLGFIEYEHVNSEILWLTLNHLRSHLHKNQHAQLLDHFLLHPV